MKYIARGGFAFPECYTHCTATDYVYYTGPNLPCTGIQTEYTLTVALQKIDEEICELFDLFYSLTSTTTTAIP